MFSAENFLASLISGMKYLHITVELTFISFIVGAVLGLIIAVIRNYRIPVASQVLAVFVTIYQGIPIVVALLLYNVLFNSFFNDAMAALHINLTVTDVNIIVLGYIALILQAMIGTTDTFRSALMAIPVNQYEAAYSVGMTKLQTLRRIILPQMLPTSIPGLINNLVGIIKSTALVTAISITEMMTGALIPCARTYSFTEGYLAAGVIYWGFTIIILFFAHRIEKKSKSFRKQPAQ